MLGGAAMMEGVVLGDEAEVVGAAAMTEGVVVGGEAEVVGGAAMDCEVQGAITRRARRTVNVGDGPWNAIFLNMIIFWEMFQEFSYIYRATAHRLQQPDQ